MKSLIPLSQRLLNEIHAHLFYHFSYSLKLQDHQSKRNLGISPWISDLSCVRDGSTCLEFLFAAAPATVAHTSAPEDFFFYYPLIITSIFSSSLHLQTCCQSVQLLIKNVVCQSITLTVWRRSEMSVSSSLLVADLTKGTNNVHAIELCVLHLSGHRCSERLWQVRWGMSYGLLGKSVHHTGLLTHVSEMTQTCLDSGVCGLRNFRLPEDGITRWYTLSSGLGFDQYLKTLAQLSLPTLLD